MKRLVIVVLTILAAYSTACDKRAMGLAPESADEPTIYISVSAGERPNEYKAVVAMANTPGIAGYNLAIGFDNTKLIPVGVREGDALKGGIVFSSNIMGAAEEKIAAVNAVTTVWASAGDNVSNGTLYSVVFRGAPSVSGQTELSLISRGIGNSAEIPVEFVLKGAVIDFDGSADNTGALRWLIVPAIMLLATTIIFVATVFNRKKRRNNMNEGGIICKRA